MAENRVAAIAAAGTSAVAGVAFGSMNSSMRVCIRSYERMQAAAQEAAETTRFQEMSLELRQVQTSAALVNQEIQEANETSASSAEKTKSILEKASSAAGQLVSKAGSMAVSFAKENYSKVFDFSDAAAEAVAGLDEINDGMQSTQELRDQIYASAQRSGSPYLGTMESVARFGSESGSAFTDNGETIAFAENLNKAFQIAGMSQDQITASSQALAKALGDGTLSGEGLQGIFGETPGLLQMMADSLGISTEQLSQMAAAGALTSEMVKNAMLGATSEIDTQFAAMPATWTDAFTRLKNGALQAFLPLLTSIGNILSTEQFQTVMDGIIAGMGQVAEFVGPVLDSMIEGAAFVVDNWSLIGPVLLGASAGLGAFLLVVKGVTIATGIWKVAQDLLNNSMRQNVIGIIVMAVAVLISMLISWVHSVGGVKVAWAICMDILKTKWSQFQIKFMEGVYSLQNTLDFLKLSFTVAKTAICNTLGLMKVGALMIIQNMINGVIEGINTFISKVNEVAGTSIPLITYTARFGTDAAAEEAVKRSKRNADMLKAAQEMKENVAARDAKLEEMRAKAQEDHRLREMEIAAMRSENAREDADDGRSVDWKQEPVAWDGNPDAFPEETACNTAATAVNTGRAADSLEVSEEDLRYMRDIAEREVIDRTVFSTITVDMGGVTNTVNNMGDLDRIPQYLADTIAEQMAVSAEGVHRDV